MSKGMKMRKWWGGSEGIWWCKLGTCLYIHSVSDLKELDEQGLVFWALPNKSSNLIMPTCPTHSILLDFKDHGNSVEFSDGIKVFL